MTACTPPVVLGTVTAVADTLPLSPAPLVLSVQSHVAFGHVGNAAAVLPLQLLGIQPVVVNTVQFSNHTGYGEFKGQVFPASHIGEVLEGLRARGILQRCVAVLSGYLGDAATGEQILAAVSEIRRGHPDMLYLCDPVIGDIGRGVFVRPGIPAFLRDRAVPMATVITPNHFEFEWLHGAPVRSVDEAIVAARAMLGAPGRPGPRIIVITSFTGDHTARREVDTPASASGAADVAAPADVELLTLGIDADGAWEVATPRVPLDPLPNGMGDVFSALLLGHLLRGMQFPAALSETVSALYALVAATAPGERDLPLVAGREQWVAPRHRFAAEAR
ncbi:pyridoxal kinase PdxY [Robbsia andropogonis]|uniref:pyridoxal kinase PdxY n=1 Tax=Robbsia andropogonis TaxID=28092 RepID=UPI000465C2F0|nr:pyridoxal kinase PdxY [Robbsia andropogonis]